MKSLLTCALSLCFALPTALIAQEAPDRTDQEQLEAKLRRDQQSILRKAERLRDLMRNLRKRYADEQRQRQVELLDKGLKHLEEIGLMDTVAGVSNDLDARALSQANQKAEKVIQDLESLLLILLDRPSMDQIDKEIDKTKAMEQSTAELERRQTALLEENQRTSESAASPAEQKLANLMRELAQMQRAEADESLRNAGTRQPFIEEALRRVQQLRAEHDALQKSLQRNRENPEAKDPVRAKLFDIGNLKQRTLEQMSARTTQRSMERVAERAERLARAATRQDAAEIREAQDALRGELARARKNQPEATAKEIDDLLAQLEAALPEKLGQTAEEIARKATAAVEKQQKANNTDLDELAGAARKTADKFAEERKAQKQQPGAPEKSLDAAAKDLAAAAETGKQADQTQKTLSNLSKALRELDEARRGLEQRNPSDEERAGRMATQAAAAARELRESPGARPEAKNDENRTGEQPKEGERPAENRAADKLDQVERNMRQAAENLREESKTRQAGEQADPQRRGATDKQLEETGRQLEEAQKALEQQLREGGQDPRVQEQAGNRQQQLRQQAQSLRDQMRQAQQNGDLSPQQQRSADQALQRAQQQMQRAEQSLRNNRNAQASQEQSRAAEQLDQARRDMERNRPLNEQQKQQLKQQAEQQKKLADDIMQLAKEAEKRRNQRAQQALDQAAQKAAEAAEELDKGENDDAEKKQEEARDALREARKELEEERERYEDLRQEELLFKIQEELNQFLAKQEPITKSTEAAGEALAKDGRLARRSRRRLNELGDAETELKNKAQYLRKALEEEDVLVFSYALKASEQDLAEVASRLGGSRPQPDNVTVVLQKDVEDRTRKLIAALKREQKRRQEQRKQQQQQQQQQQQNQNQDNNQQRRQRLVSIVAELEMLKQMEQDMLKRTEFMGKLIEARGDAVSDVDLSLLERLAHRHAGVTEIFMAVKKQVESILNPEAGGEQSEDKAGDPDKKKKGGGK